MEKKEIFDRIEYVVTCVSAFAQRFNLSNQQAYAYLRRFSGIDFLLDCYTAEHTLSIDDAVSESVTEKEGLYDPSISRLQCSHRTSKTH